MAQLIIRRLEQSVKTKLQSRAKRHGRSMEEEVREILRDATKSDIKPRKGFGTEVAALFRGVGLRPGEEIPEMHFEPRIADFEE